MNIWHFASLLEREQIEDLKRRKLDCPANIKGSRVKVIPGTKYTKVNVGSSGKYRVDKAGNIFGIKAYGKIHKGRRFGTLETINEWYWGGYEAVRKREEIIYETDTA